jgi:hypothetical protein
VHAAITAALGFLVAVLWFDLMFDVQVVAHRGETQVPDDVVDSIATYYRRVTTDASPMGRLVAIVMVVLLALLVSQAVRSATPGWVSIVSLAGAGAAIVLAISRVVPRAVRLGAGSDAPEGRSDLARGIFRDHVVFLALIVAVLVVQLVAGT